MRWTALLLVLALTATSASRLACVVECVDVQGEAHAAAACHEVPAKGPSLTASASHCPLTPDGTVIGTAKGSEPQRLRLTRAATAASALKAGPTVTPRFDRAAPSTPRHSVGSAFQTNSVLRI